jgi:hypothetical protein
MLTEETNRLKKLAADARVAVPDLCYYPLFAVRCFEMKEEIASMAEALIREIAETVQRDNGELMVAIGQSYETIVQKLVTEPLDCAALKELQQYSTDSIGELNELQEQLSNDVCTRVQFLLRQELKGVMPRESVAQFATTYMWPNSVKEFQNRSWELQNSRKRELEVLLEGRQQQLLRDFSSIGKRLEKIAEFGSLLHHEVAAVVKRIGSVTEQLLAAETAAEEIQEQEIMLGRPETDNMTRLQELKVRPPAGACCT